MSDLAASELTHKPLLHTRGISNARSCDLEVALWAPTRLTSCIVHPGLAEAYERRQLTLCPTRAPFHHLTAPESIRKPLANKNWKTGGAPSRPRALGFGTARRRLGARCRRGAAGGTTEFLLGAACGCCGGTCTWRAVESHVGQASRPP